MEESVKKQTGIAMALLERFETQRQPYAMSIKEKVDKGELLSDSDVEFLKQVLDDSVEIKHLISENSEWLPLYERIANMYQEIISKALENEKAAGKEKLTSF